MKTPPLAVRKETKTRLITLCFPITEKYRHVRLYRLDGKGFCLFRDLGVATVGRPGKQKYLGELKLEGEC